MSSNPSALALQLHGLEGWARWLACASPGADIFEANGVVASLVPATPARSIPNSVVYESVDALDRAIQKVDAAYKEAGVESWAVWVPEDDAEAIAMLSDAKLKFDGEPAAMNLDLASFEPRELGDLDWDADGEAATCVGIADEAFGVASGGGWSAAFSGSDSNFGGLARFYQARVGGKAVCAVATLDYDDDLGVYMVGTLGEHRGKGIMTRLLSQALAEGRERGLKTSTLQASDLGEPLYHALGYERPFRWNLYERRLTPAGDGGAT